MARQTDNTPKDGYSRMVRVFRIAFPVIALLLLASIFVLSKTSRLREALIVTDAKLAELAIGQKITNPHFSGVTKTGDAFSISAEWALPDAPSPERIDLNKPLTTIDFQDGRSLKSKSETGLLDLSKNMATLSGIVSLVTSDGYTAQSDELQLNFETGNVLSPGPVTAVGPQGSIEAGSMELRQDLNKNHFGGKGVLLFKNGVKLVYIPKPNR